MPEPRPGAAAARLAGPAAALLPGAAAAHGPVPGLDGLSHGLATPLAEPALGLAAIALLVLLIQDFPQRLRRGLPLHLAGVALGLVAGRALALALPLEPAMLALAGAAAGLAALAGDRATPAALALLPLLGLGTGALALPDPGPAGAVGATTLGALFGAYLPLLAGGGAVAALRDRFPGAAARHALGTGTRIAAAWTAAIAVLMLAFVLRPAA